MRSIGIWIVAFLVIAFLGSSGFASAKGEWDGPTIAHGTSDGGIKWRIWAVRAERNLYTVEFGSSMRAPVKFDTTDIDGFAFAIDPKERYPSVMAVRGRRLGPEHESAVSGLASRYGRYVVFTMSSGKAVRRKSIRVSANLAKKWPELRQFRYFNEYFDSHQVLVRVAAVNGSGEVLGRQTFSHPADRK